MRRRTLPGGGGGAAPGEAGLQATAPQWRAWQPLESSCMTLGRGRGATGGQSWQGTQMACLQGAGASFW